MFCFFCLSSYEEKKTSAHFCMNGFSSHTEAVHTKVRMFFSLHNLINRKKYKIIL